MIEAIMMRRSNPPQDRHKRVARFQSTSGHDVNLARKGMYGKWNLLGLGSCAGSKCKSSDGLMEPKNVAHDYVQNGKSAVMTQDI